MTKSLYSLPILLLCAILFSCSKKTIPYNNNAPEDYNLEWQKTHDPNTQKVEGQRLWSFLLDQKPLMGETNSLDKARIYPASWRPIDDFFASLAVQRMVFDPKNTQVFYFCTGEGWNNAEAARGAGVWKSEDAGKTWRQLSATLSDTFYYCHDMMVHPVTSDVYVATRSGGLMRSQDGGASWNQVLGTNNGSIFNTSTDIELTKDNEIFVSIGNFNTDGIYFSANGNPGSWEKRMNGLPTENRRIEIATAPSNANYIYAIPTSSVPIDSNRIHGIYKSTDKGKNWVKVGLPGEDRNMAKVQGWYDLIIKVDPNNEQNVLAGGLNVYRSTNGGDTWQLLFDGDRRSKKNLQYVHVDQHEIVFKDSDTVLFGNDGGIYRCNNMRADTPVFFMMNDNYNVTQFYSCAIENVKGSARVIGGTQDNGSLGSTDTGISVYDQLSWADGSYCNINHKNPNTFFTTTQYQRIYRFRDKTIDTIANPKLNSKNTQFINPIEMDPNDPELLYQLSEIGLWRLNKASTDSKNDWQQACRAFGSFTAIGISTTPANIAFIGRNSGGKLWRVDNVNTTNENVFPTSCDPQNQLPTAAYCNCVYVNPTDANHVIAIYSNYGVESVWECKNALDATPNWVSQEGNLPDIPIRWAVLHPTNSEVCYIATEAGVMMTTKLNGAETKWVSMNKGLANIKVNMLRLRESDMSLVAATHGRGMFMGTIKGDFTVDWEERGPLNVGGRTRTMMFDPNDPTGKRLWAGSVSGGLWVVNNYDSVTKYIEDPTVDFEVKVGPNPFVGTGLNIYLTTNTERKFLLELYKITGEVLEIQELNLKSGTHELRLDMPMAATAIYFLRVTSGKDVKVFKLLGGN